MVPVIRPTLPNSEVPPISTAEIASSSDIKPLPDWAVKVRDICPHFMTERAAQFGIVKPRPPRAVQISMD